MCIIHNHDLIINKLIKKTVDTWIRLKNIHSLIKFSIKIFFVCNILQKCTL